MIFQSLKPLISVSPTSNLTLFLHQSSLTHCRLDLVHPGRANPPFKSPVTLGQPEMCPSEMLRFLFCHNRIWIRQCIKTIFYFPPFINAPTSVIFLSTVQSTNAATFVLLKTYFLFQGGRKKKTNFCTFVEKNYDSSLSHIPVPSICLKMKIKHSVFTYENCTQR